MVDRHAGDRSGVVHDRLYGCCRAVAGKRAGKSHERTLRRGRARLSDQHGNVLHNHHEMAYVGTSTKMPGFLARSAVRNKGQNFLSDNVRATDAIIETELGRKLIGETFERVGDLSGKW